MGPKKKKKGGKAKKGGGDPSALNDDLDIARLRMQNEELRVLLSFERADKKKVSQPTSGRKAPTLVAQSMTPSSRRTMSQCSQFPRTPIVPDSV